MAKDLRKAGVIIATVTVALLIISISIFLFVSTRDNKKSNPIIEIMSVLEEVSDLSQLSTYTNMYQGVVKVNNEEKPDKVDYYVTYDATIRAGIDLKAVTEKSFTLNEDTQVIELTLPEVTIEEPVINPDSLDYIFINKKANTPNAYQKALEVCENDVMQKTENMPEIKEQAKKNAKKALEALTKALIEQINKNKGTNYRLDIKG